LLASRARVKRGPKILVEVKLRTAHDVYYTSPLPGATSLGAHPRAPAFRSAAFQANTAPNYAPDAEQAGEAFRQIDNRPMEAMRSKG